ncbi:arsenite methyltransferase, partial [Ferrimicrobium sp.]
CYARQDKFWVNGPDGIRWEHYVVLANSDAPGFSSLFTDKPDNVCCATPHSDDTPAEQAEPVGPADIRETVRRHYAAVAVVAGESSNKPPSCCGPSSFDVCGPGGEAVFGAALYAQSGEDTMSNAVAASLGCGVPTAVADLHPGEVVLDLGSGAGADVLIAAQRVQPGGRAIGLDMTVEMLELARRNAAIAQVDNVEFIEGYLEEIPLPDVSVDVVISNCVINLAADKRVVLREAARVLKPGGRFAISDVVADADLNAEIRASMTEWTGCIGGALNEVDYRNLLSDSGFEQIEIIETHRVHSHATAAIVRARRTTAATNASSRRH